MSELSQGAIIGISVPSVALGLWMCYMCCCRKEANARNTQKLMDATNLMHAQEPQGLMSAGVMPDGTVGLLVRPLPSSGVLPHQPQPLPIQQQQLSYSPYIPPVPTQQYPLSAPSAPYQPESALQHQLQLSTHPRPQVVTSTGNEIKAGEDIPYVPSASSHGQGPGSFSGPVHLSSWTSPAPPVSAFTVPATATTAASSPSSVPNVSRPVVVRGPEERSPDTQPFYTMATPTAPYLSSVSVNASVEKAMLDSSQCVTRSPNNPHGPI
ncbi:hypothetical protein BGZ95_010498 [Linnemannia exigua]|uniref:Uncharacterized protein n=1 Tax=Linnemannia exigua TaxID=604196 RepID=A0AAD4DB87_9FUNG|nr:hypothetical protein BGZ95_010498 [Linnemannia exigua]